MEGIGRSSAVLANWQVAMEATGLLAIMATLVGF
jgi:hypothetical protein